MKLAIPELSLVVLIGPSGAGKSTFAAARFKPTETLSSDFFRGLVSDDENCQAATKDAFDALLYVAGKRLAAGRLTVIDATNVRPEDRKTFVDLARTYHCLPTAIVFDLPERVCVDRSKERDDRPGMSPRVIAHQRSAMRRGLRGLKREGFRRILKFRSPEEVEAAEIVREPLWNNKKHERGPFDIVGDVHGCLPELLALLAKLGYRAEKSESAPYGWAVEPPEGRKLIFVGDLCDRGPDTPGVFRLAMGMVEAGTAFCVPGNHEARLLRKFRGKNVALRYGLEETLAQLESEPPEFVEKLAEFIDGLVSHYVLDGGNLVVAHAGLKEEMQGRGSGKVREFALYGETTGETDEFGLPVRLNWALDYRGPARVVYGHTPVPEAQWLNRTINIDTGCAFGGRLTALRYPEMELVDVPALETYAEPVRPLDWNAPLSAQQQADDLLDYEDASGKRFVETWAGQTVSLREEETAAALEVLSRFAVDPAWLIHLPPTMSPSETSAREGLLEHPDEALGHFAKEGVARAVCQEKHMGSRAIVIACRDAQAARERFGVQTGEAGCCHTRTGRRFFNDAALEAEFLGEVRGALDRSGFWEKFETGWVCLDCELMPWSLKAGDLVRDQYASVGAAARASLPAGAELLERAASRDVDFGGEPLAEAWRSRAAQAEKYVDAYRRYCWPAETLAECRLAPFHVLATEGAVHRDKDHLWHMEAVAEIARAGTLSERAPELIMPTSHLVVDLGDPASREAAVRWWEELTSRGGEGMVVKPLDFAPRQQPRQRREPSPEEADVLADSPGGVPAPAQEKRGRLVQPALKCRGPEYLRIIYGPEYDAPDNLARLRRRGLGRKRSLAMREFVLGIEALERFVRREPLRRVHECVLGVLALESEAVDPRL